MRRITAVVRTLSFVGVVAALLLAVAFGAPTGSSASASGPWSSAAHKATLTPVAGDSHYLVFASFDHGRLGHGQTRKHGSLIALTRSGHSRVVASITNFAYRFSISHAMVVYEQGLNKPSMHWINLASGRSGTFAPHLSDVAAPDGWFYLKFAHGYSQDASEALYEHRLDVGNRRRLGTPIKRAHAANMSVGPNDIAIFQNAPDEVFGKATVMPFDHPGRFHTLIKRHRSSTSECLTLTATHTLCSLSTATTFRERLIDLVTGKTVIDLKPPRCGGDPVILGETIAWVQDGCAHRLEYVTASGHITTSKRVFAAHQSVTALGGVVAPTRSLHHLVLFLGRGHSKEIAG
ncbi:MAG TPA: hypothetical protein VMH41_01810 [Mycobacteriales bacterium]|nr:hypothetical protein [Mycobacteriales bacterium]